MPHTEGGKTFAFHRPGSYRIRVLGFLDESWSNRLGGLRITACSLKDQGPVTSLAGELRDQANWPGC
jgi:hypothetical protein